MTTPPGRPKMVSTPAAFSDATIASEPFISNLLLDLSSRFDVHRFPLFYLKNSIGKPQTVILQQRLHQRHGQA
jgi:hypothetical protein